VEASGSDNAFGSTQNCYLSFVCLLMPLPLLVTMNIAATSTLVVELTEALNEKAIEVGFKQGSGANVVLNTRAQAGELLAGHQLPHRRLGPRPPLAAQLQPLADRRPRDRGDRAQRRQPQLRRLSTCELTTQESATIRAAMGARNASGAYNMSVASVLI